MRRAEAIERLAQVAREQAGYVTRGQAGRLGVPARDLVRLARSGDLRRVARGVYALAGAFAGPREPAIAAWLRLVGAHLPWEAGPPPAIASHSTAASIHGFGTFTANTPTFTVAKRRHQPEDGSMHIHVTPVEPTDWGWVDLPEGLRFPVTTPARTVVDLAWSGEDRDHVLDALDEAQAAGLATVDQVRGATDRRRRRRGRGSSVWLEAVLRRR